MLKQIIEKQKVEQFAAWMRDFRKFVIVAHANPDGDAVGSALALWHLLRRCGKRAVVIFPNAYPDFFKWMPGSKEIMIYSRMKEVADGFISGAEVICCLDFNSLSRVENMRESIAASSARKIMIDHHLDPDGFCDITVSHPDQSSTCELLLRFFCDLGAYGRINTDIATCIYTGMMTDTGGFTYNSNRPEIFGIVSMLLMKGIDKDMIYRKVNYNFSAGRLYMQGIVLSDMEIVPECHAAILTLTREDEKKYGEMKGDTEGFVNLPLQIRDVILTCFLREDTERDVVKVSLRSVGEFPTNILAGEFGGGGHKNASGGEMPCVDVQKAKEKFKEVLMRYKDQLDECFAQHPK